MSTPEIPVFTTVKTAVAAVLAEFEQAADPELIRPSGRSWPANSTLLIPMSGLPVKGRTFRKLRRGINRRLRTLMPVETVSITGQCIQVLADKTHADAPVSFAASVRQAA